MGSSAGPSSPASVKGLQRKARVSLCLNSPGRNISNLSWPTLFHRARHSSVNCVERTVGQRRTVCSLHSAHKVAESHPTHCPQTVFTTYVCSHVCGHMSSTCGGSRFKLGVILSHPPLSSLSWGPWMERVRPYDEGEGHCRLLSGATVQTAPVPGSPRPHAGVRQLCLGSLLLK